MNNTNHLDWTLLIVRLIVGTAFIMHGGHNVAAHLHSISSPLYNIQSFLTVCFTPLTELIGGSLIFTGILIELATLLVLPIIFLSFLLSNPQSFTPGNFKIILNLTMLAIAIGICGPGKWALWDPGKDLRKKIF